MITYNEGLDWSFCCGVKIKIESKSLQFLLKTCLDVTHVMFVINLGYWKMLCVKGNCIGMVGPFEGFHVKLMQSILDINDYDDLKLFQLAFKLHIRYKQHWVLVEWTHLNMMVRSYNCHFAKYSKEKKNVTQLIPTLVWKAIYAKYREIYFDNIFWEDTLRN